MLPMLPRRHARAAALLPGRYAFLHDEALHDERRAALRVVYLEKKTRPNTKIQ